MENTINKDEKFMNEALKEAKKAYKIGEVPIGAVIVKDEKIISRGYNQKELKKDITKHAEIIAIQKASKKINNWRLNNCTIYVTLNPCDMCESAIMQSRIKNIVIGTMYEHKGAVESHIKDRLQFKKCISVKTGIMETECRKILKDFFEKVRKDSKE